MKTKKYIYGRNHTIHRTKLLNVEVDERTGEVVSIWFRCLALPFDVTKVNKERAKEMKTAYEKDMKINISAIEFEER